MDPYLRFLENTWLAAQSLAEESRVLRIRPRGVPPPAAYLLSFDIPYLRLTNGGSVEIAPGPVTASIYLPPEYLHSGDPSLPLRVVTVDTPRFVHPNVNRTVCLGSAFRPGTPFRALVGALYSVLTYRVFSTDERNALNPMACRLLREHAHLLAGHKTPPLAVPVKQMRTNG